MRRTDLSLDEEIAEVEGRLSHRRMQLRALSDEARSRVSVKSATPVALAVALQTLLNNTALWQRMSQAALERARTLFSNDSLVASLLERALR
jgi:hypothetical protein